MVAQFEGGDSSSEGGGWLLRAGGDPSAGLFAPVYANLQPALARRCGPPPYPAPRNFPLAPAGSIPEVRGAARTTGRNRASLPPHAAGDPPTARSTPQRPPSLRRPSSSYLLCPECLCVNSGEKCGLVASARGIAYTRKENLAGRTCGRFQGTGREARRHVRPLAL